MILARTNRAMTFNGKEYAQGDTLTMGQDQFDALEGMGWVDRAPEPVEPEPKKGKKPV